MNQNDVERYFTYHNPAGIDPVRFEFIRNAAKSLATQIIEYGGNPSEIEKSIESLRICIFHAIASIVLPEKEGR